MSTVCPAPLLLSLVHLNVRYIEGINIKTFDLCSREIPIISITLRKQIALTGHRIIADLSIALCILEKI
jgi:hypothetical protein